MLQLQIIFEDKTSGATIKSNSSTLQDSGAAFVRIDQRGIYIAEIHSTGGAKMRDDARHLGAVRS